MATTRTHSSIFAKPDILKLYSTDGAKRLGLDEPLGRKVTEGVLVLELEKKYDQFINKLEADVKEVENKSQRGTITDRETATRTKPSARNHKISWTNSLT